MEPDEQSEKAGQRGGELGRMAGKFAKNLGPRTKRFIEENRPRVEKAVQDSRPKLEKAVQDYRPKVEQAGRDAMRYAQEHEDELRNMALKGARMRLGPLGMAIDALGIGGEQAGPSPAPGTCPKCQATNATNSKFCSQCGERLPDQASSSNQK